LASVDGIAVPFAAERARASVTSAVRHALARIRTHHAAFAVHVERAIRTEPVCADLPDPRVSVDWTRKGD
jgi:hypothetical protein